MISKIIRDTPIEKLDKEVLGEFSYCIFSNEENKYSVCEYYLKSLEGKALGQSIVFGYGLPIYHGIKYKMTGEWVKHKKYGKQFKVYTYEQYVAKEKESIIAYLESGIIKGIGKKKAETIYNIFGDATLEVLDKEPNRLLEVKGIGKAALEKIKKSYIDARLSKDNILWLISLGISAEVSGKIFAELQENTKSAITNNPYRIANFARLPFKQLDVIAERVGIKKDSPVRFDACVKHTLKQAEVTGSMGMELNEFGNYLRDILGRGVIPEAEISDMVLTKIKLKELYCKRIEGKQYIFSQKNAEMECNTAKNLLALCEDTSLNAVVDEEQIYETSKFLGYRPDKTQVQAVKHCLASPVMVLSGGPGTGKTSVIRIVLEWFKNQFPENEIYQMAPTGQAAKRMSEVTGESAKTIHSTLQLGKEYSKVEIAGVDWRDEVVIENALVIVDEVSMLDAYVANKLFNCIKKGCKVLLVGDVDQLPSVGPGMVLKSIIESNTIPVIFLNTVYRQSEYSQIYLNAKRICKGDTDIKEGDDFFFYPESNMETIAENMVKDYVNRVVEYGFNDVRCLCPFREQVGGVYDMNRRIQAFVNPPKEELAQIEVGNVVFRENDLVMNLNNRDEIVNGDIGYITNINVKEQKVYVSFATGKEEYEYKDAKENLIHAYAMTIHKSEGIECKAVIMCLTAFHSIMLKRNLLYTGITRGKQYVGIHGEYAAVRTAINNIPDDNRVTLLTYFLHYYAGHFVSVA